MSARLSSFFVVIAFLVTMGCCTTLHADDTGSNGYVSLFNGKDLTGWQTNGNWVVEEGGVLALKPAPGKRGLFSYRLFLWTKRTYRDFILDLEFKLDKGGDSSVFFRSRSFGRFIEVEVADSHGKEEPLTMDDCGAIRNGSPPTKNMAKPAGKWNRMIITCKGSQVEVKLNGEQVNEVDFAELERSAPSSGTIGLQDWGSPVWYRNIRIKELN